MPFRHFFAVLLIFGTISPVLGDEKQKVPDRVYPDLEYVLSLSQSTAELDPKKLSDLIGFVSSREAESGMELNERHGASGAFYGFSVQGDLASVLDYVYNPEIPLYVMMPSSLRQHEWLSSEVTEVLSTLPRRVESASDIRLLRGRDRETITPDTNTGGYYSYEQERVVTILPGPSGPVLISVSSQNDISEVGKKGCIVGNDKDWNYLYSNETGLNKTGMGWLDTYMYFAHSVLVYVVDSSTNTIYLGSFKWLNAGWASMNMVESSHILKGIKRFASDFKSVMEAPGLPSAQVLAEKYRELQQKSKSSLQEMVSPYLKVLNNSETSGLDSSLFKDLLTSGEYLQQMSHDELIKVLLIEYIKGAIGKKSLVRLASQSYK